MERVIWPMKMERWTTGLGISMTKTNLPAYVKAMITRNFGRDEDLCDGINPGREAAIQIAEAAYRAGQRDMAQDQYVRDNW